MRVVAAIGALLLLALSLWRLRTGRRRRAALGAAGALLLFLYATGGGPPVPDGEGAVEDAADALGGWVYPFAVACAFFETTIPPVTLVIPGEWGLMLTGAIAGAGRADVVVLVAIGWLVSVVADSICYLLGRRLGRPFLVRHGRAWGLTHERLARVERWFDRYGAATACFGRLLPLARPFGPFLAGSALFPYRRFLPWNVLGCLLFALVFCLSGYAFYNSYAEVAQAVGRASLLALVAAVAIAVLIRDLRRRRAGEPGG